MSSVTLNGDARRRIEEVPEGLAALYINYLLEHYGFQPELLDNATKRPYGADSRIFAVRFSDKARAALDQIAGNYRSRYLSALIMQREMEIELARKKSAKLAADTASVVGLIALDEFFRT